MPCLVSLSCGRALKELVRRRQGASHGKKNRTKPRTGEGRELAGVQADVGGFSVGFGVGPAPVWEIRGSLEVIFSRGVEELGLLAWLHCFPA